MEAISAYQSTGAESADEVVRRYAPLVRRTAYHLLSRLPPSVQVDDLVQAGMLGLLDAVGRFDAAREASFKTFAELRIRGAMLDELRHADWVPRSVHRKAREVAAAIGEVERIKGAAALDHEVAEHLGLSLAEYHDRLVDLSGQKLLSVEDLSDGEDSLPASRDSSPEQLLSETQFAAQLAEAIRQLPEREQIVLSLYYDEELNLREIGAVLGVSESRVSQIRSQALLRLRSALPNQRQSTAGDQYGQQQR